MLTTSKNVRNNEQYAEDVGTSANESRFLEDPVSMLDQVFFRGCTQQAAKVNNSILMENTAIVQG